MKMKPFDSVDWSCFAGAEECDLNPADVEAVVLGQIWNAMRDCFGIEQELENAYLEQHDEEYNK